MNLTMISNIYAVLSLFCCGAIAWLIYKVSKSKIDIKENVIFSLCSISSAVVSYSLFLFSSKYFNALFFYCLYLTGTAWTVYSMYTFTLVYTTNSLKLDYTKVFFAIGAFFDTVYLLANMRVLHVFDLEQKFTESGFSYWGVHYFFGNEIHVGYCYFTAVITLLLLIFQTFKAQGFFKTKYITIIASYSAVAAVNYIVYAVSLSVDLSVLLLAVLSFAVFDYAISNFSSYLVIDPLTSINETIQDAILSFDYEGRLVYHNNAAKKLFNKSDEDLKTYAEQFRVLFLEDKPKEMTLELADGETHHYVTEYKDFYIKDSLAGSYLKLEDKTEEIKESQKRRYIATHDPLTGLLNRSGFFQEAQEALENGFYKNPIIICSNIKDFSVINDIYGEIYGDEVLKTQATMMAKYGHRKNINGRLGDDKFAILMEKSDFNQEFFEEAFNQLSALTENGTYHMSISAGVYEIYNKRESIQLIYDKAKMAMDAINNDYQKVFSFYDSTMMDRLLAEKNIVNEFEHAIDDMQFDIQLQPIINGDGQTLGAEALVRWKHPKQQLLYPEAFISILEKTGLIYKLDMYVWELAARKLKDWQNKGFTDKFICVNISDRDKYFINIDEVLISLIDKYKIPAENFRLEIQEKALVESPQKSIDIFYKLKKAGFKIYIDRFGSGYSSLNMLKDFEADGVKMDTEFLGEDELSSKNKIILETMISMAKDLHMSVMAVGVETKSHIQTLTQLGCSIFQGFYWTRPLQIREFESLYLK